MSEDIDPAPWAPPSGSRWRSKKQWIAAGVTLLLFGGCAAALNHGSTPRPSANSTTQAVARTQLQLAMADCPIVPPAASLGDEGHSLVVDGAGNDNAAGDPDYATINQIGCLLSRLKVTDAITAQMDSTTALQGRQSASWGSGLSATWTYHPDHGLDIIFTER